MSRRTLDHKRSPSGLSWLLGCLLLLLTFGFCTVAGVMLAQLRQEAWTGAERNSKNILGTVSTDIARNFELYDLSLQAVVDGLQLPGLPDLSEEIRQAVLYDRATTAKYLGTIVILNEHGVVVDNAGEPLAHSINLADRDFFDVHRQRSDAGLYVSAPRRAREINPGKLVIVLSRRVNHPDGSFAGVVVGTLRVDYFRDLFASVDIGPRGAVALFRTDGAVLARKPFDDSVLGRSLPQGKGMAQFAAAQSGMFHAEGVLDGIPRVVSFTHVATLPLVLTVSLSEADIYAAWNVRAEVIAGVLLGLCTAVAWLGFLFSREMARRARAEQAMRASEAQYRLLAENATDVIARFGPDLSCTYVSPSCRVMLGYEAWEVSGPLAAHIIHPDDRRDVADLVRAARSKGQNCAVTYRMLRKGGGTVWIEGHYSYMSSDDGFAVVLRDITARKNAEDELEAAHAELTRVAATDALTGIANRRRFDEVLAQEWRRAARDEHALTLLLLDVDRFKLFNDRYGHQQGDVCLQAVAQAVAGSAMRPADLVARYGGEEIAVLLPDTEGANAALVGERVRSAIEALGISHEGNEAHGGVVTASIGVATVIPPRADQSNVTTISSPSSLVAAADLMLYEAKRNGRNRVALFKPSPVLSDSHAWLEQEAVS